MLSRDKQVAESGYQHREEFRNDDEPLLLYRGQPVLNQRQRFATLGVAVEETVALRLESTVEELIRTIHAHPTMAEAVGEAAHAVHGAAIHM